MKHDGKSNFIISPYVGSGRQGGSLVNEIGAYSGTQIYRGAGVFFLKVVADGAWTIDLSAL